MQKISPNLCKVVRFVFLQNSSNLQFHNLCESRQDRELEKGNWGSRKMGIGAMATTMNLNKKKKDV
jgi:hypothetical protein